MKSLLDAICVAFNTNASLTAAFNGDLRIDRPERGTAQPYCHLSVGRSTNTAVYGDASAFQDATIDFVGFGPQLIPLLEKMELVCSTFDDFAPAGVTLLNWIRQGDAVPQAAPVEEGIQTNVWRASVSYLATYAEA